MYQWCQKHSLPFVCLPVAVIVELIVGRESYEASPSSREREEDLSGCVLPHLMKEKREHCRWGAGRNKQCKRHCGWIQRACVSYLCIIKLLPLRCNKIEDAIKGTGEGHSPDQQDDQHHIGKCGCEINHLSREETGHNNKRQEERDTEGYKNIMTKEYLLKKVFLGKKKKNYSSCMLTVLHLHLIYLLFAMYDILVRLSNM